MGNKPVDPRTVQALRQTRALLPRLASSFDARRDCSTACPRARSKSFPWGWIRRLLSGTESYVGLDAVALAPRDPDPELLQAIDRLFGAREPIPGPEEFPEVRPLLDDYAFPDQLLGRVVLAPNLMQSATRRPWTVDMIMPSTIDLIVSQAVMEHVADLDATYRAMATWLRPGGLASHQIDFRSHGKSRAWNGHWRYPRSLWLRLGGQAHPINREPLSAHLAAIERAGLTVRTLQPIIDQTGIRRRDLDRSFRYLSDSDLVTAGAYVQLVRLG